MITSYNISLLVIDNKNQFTKKSEGEENNKTNGEPKIIKNKTDTLQDRLKSLSRFFFFWYFYVFLPQIYL